MQVSLDREKSNEAIRNGTIEKVMQQARERLHPEAMYFGAFGGTRTAFIVFDLTHESDLPSVSEPFFMELGGSITMSPVMNPEDLAAGLAKLA